MSVSVILLMILSAAFGGQVVYLWRAIKNEKLAEELILWVENYAKRVCHEGCLPTPGQEREITMFAKIVRALRGQS
jgi:hypothetical protein